MLKKIKNIIKKIIYKPINCDGKVHEWFELTYAQYLTIPRSVLESMPDKWQEKFVDCLTELDNTIDWRPTEGRYWVQLKDDKGKYKQDPFREYRYPVPIQHRVQKEPVCRTYNSFIKRYFPDTYEKEIRVGESPEEFGRRIAKENVEKHWHIIEEALNKVIKKNV